MGHSLGTALATLAVATLGEEAKPVHGLYTFGQEPRISGKTFARNFDLDFKSRTFRVGNNVVTLVPIREMGYRQVGQVLVFDSSGKLPTDLHFWNNFFKRVGGVELRIWENSEPME